MCAAAIVSQVLSLPPDSSRWEFLFGFLLRMIDGGATAEEVYLRQHKSGAPDAMQYTPVLSTGRNWQIYNGPGFTGAVDIPKNEWFHLRLVVTGAQAKLYVKDMSTPALDMTDLNTPDAPWQRHLPPMPADVLTTWSISPSFDALTWGFICRLHALKD